MTAIASPASITGASLTTAAAAMTAVPSPPFAIFAALAAGGQWCMINNDETVMKTATDYFNLHKEATALKQDMQAQIPRLLPDDKVTDASKPLLVQHNDTFLSSMDEMESMLRGAGDAFTNISGTLAKITDFSLAAGGFFLAVASYLTLTWWNPGSQAQGAAQGGQRQSIVMKVLTRLKSLCTKIQKFLNMLKSKFAGLMKGKLPTQGNKAATQVARTARARKIARATRMARGGSNNTTTTAATNGGKLGRFRKLGKLALPLTGGFYGYSYVSGEMNGQAAGVTQVAQTQIQWPGEVEGDKSPADGKKSADPGKTPTRA